MDFSRPSERKCSLEFFNLKTSAWAILERGIRKMAVNILVRDIKSIASFQGMMNSKELV